MTLFNLATSGTKKYEENLLKSNLNEYKKTAGSDKSVEHSHKVPEHKTLNVIISPISAGR